MYERLFIISLTIGILFTNDVLKLTKSKPFLNVVIVIVGHTLRVIFGSASNEFETDALKI